MILYIFFYDIGGYAYSLEMGGGGGGRSGVGGVGGRGVEGGYQKTSSFYDLFMIFLWPRSTPIRNIARKQIILKKNHKFVINCSHKKIIFKS